MTNIIQNIADKAKAEVPDGLSVDDWVAAYNQAFAKLVIEECLGVMSAEEKKPAGFIYSKGVDTHEYAIKTHFGIEVLTRSEQFRKDFEAVFKDGVDLSGKETP